MRGVIAVPKQRLDELVKEAKEDSPRKGSPHAPGRKRISQTSRLRKKAKRQNPK